jgi:hypothetical protein
MGGGIFHSYKYTIIIWGVVFIFLKYYYWGGVPNKKVWGVFPRIHFTLSRNAGDWEILVYIIM